MAQRIDGKAVSAKVRAEVAQEVAALKERGVPLAWQWSLWEMTPPLASM